MAGGYVKWPPTGAIFPKKCGRWHFENAVGRENPAKSRPVDSIWCLQRARCRMRPHRLLPIPTRLFRCLQNNIPCQPIFRNLNLSSGFQIYPQGFKSIHRNSTQSSEIQVYQMNSWTPFRMPQRPCHRRGHETRLRELQRTMNHILWRQVLRPAP